MDKKQRFFQAGLFALAALLLTGCSNQPDASQTDTTTTKETAERTKISPKVIPPSRYRQVELLSSGSAFSCATTPRTVRCWGPAMDATDRTPGFMPAVSAIAAGVTHACALHHRRVSCWGSNHYGESDVPELTEPTAIAAGVSHS